MKVSRRLYWVLLTLLLTTFSPFVKETESSQILLVMFKLNVSEQRIDNINDRIGVTVLRKTLNNAYYVLPARGKTIQEVIREYKALPEVEEVSIGGR